ncbi:GlxA family transcriptional regulator [Rhizobium sp. S-51]|uniref:GlxA family transcriptional regulator n=1 Tax=Rhizobium terricola TaxID=2728849 RepID=A0A7Y0B079_9HYPH|nr:GlxA family transcriptional regulator [Rhizobium terricola]NML76749.1 GlxA family transcriptional regulator [Rhizobium terricola]
MSESLSSSTHGYGFVLVPNFALMSYASATEPLRAANLIAQTKLFSVKPLSCDGSDVVSSSGLAIPCGDLAEEGARCHTIFVVAGGNPSDWRSASAIFPTLRRLGRQGVRIGGISSGSFLLAAAGLLDGRDFTIHWEHAPALAEAFPHLAPRQARYVLDGDRITCGGGVAPLDMMHALISERMGSAFARRVSDWYLHTAIAEPGGPQRGSSVERFGTRHPALVTVLETMETTIEHPLSRKDMARLAGISPRHLDRLFAEQMAQGFLETYRDVRLAHARRLLEQSPLAISEVAFATGFSSASHFSRAYKQRFGIRPKSARS